MLLLYRLALPSGLSKTFSRFNVAISSSFRFSSSFVGYASEIALVTPHCALFWPSMIVFAGLVTGRATSGVLRRADAEAVAVAARRRVGEGCREQQLER